MAINITEKSSMEINAQSFNIALGQRTAPYLANKTYVGFKEKSCVVCQGGGAKGAWQAGVLHSLYSKNINPISFFGTSVGALNASLCFTGQWKALSEIWAKNPPIHIFKKKLLSCFLLNYHGLYDLIDFYIRNNLVEDAIKSKSIYIRASDMTSGLSKLFVFTNNLNDGCLSECLKASTSLYPYFPIYKIGDISYADGGLAANCPVDLVNNIGVVESIIISPSQMPVKQASINSAKDTISRMVDLLLHSQLIADINLLKSKLIDWNMSPHRKSIGNYKTAYFISPSKPLHNDTIDITKDGSVNDFNLGIEDANTFMSNPGKYDLERWVYSKGL